MLNNIHIQAHSPVLLFHVLHIFWIIWKYLKIINKIKECVCFFILEFAKIRENYRNYKNNHKWCSVYLIAKKRTTELFPIVCSLCQARLQLKEMYTEKRAKRRRKFITTLLQFYANCWYRMYRKRPNQLILMHLISNELSSSGGRGWNGILLCLYVDTPTICMEGKFPRFFKEWEILFGLTFL